MNQKAGILWSLFWAALSLTYSIFLLIYLNNTGKYKNQMSSRDKKFRKAAVIITWIAIILGGLGVIGLLIALVAGGKVRGSGYISMPASPVAMNFY